MPSKGKELLARDPVLSAAVVAAVGSAFWAPPSPAYFGYLDMRVLCLLLALMLTVAGLREAGVFDRLLCVLLRRVHSSRALALALVGICFFSAMFITNDVALLTFVPFAVLVLTRTGQERRLIPVIVLQTVAANLGSMLTPLGNPQNLYLYSLSGMTAAAFLRVMALPTALSLALLAGAVCFLKSEPVKAPETAETASGSAVPWLILFCVCLAAVLRIVHYALALGVVAAFVFVRDRKLLRQADYGLLATFVAFFVFIGNLKSIPTVNAVLSALVAGHESAAGVLLSQIISNVPAAMLLSGFTRDYAALLIGVNLGGLGTLIASMASLISYKQFALTAPKQKGRYLAIFTAVNCAFLAVLYPVCTLLH